MTSEEQAGHAADDDATPDISPSVLAPRQRAHLRRRARDLEPALTIGKAGLSDGVVAEIERLLAGSDLIKVRTPRGASLDADALAARLDATLVQQVGRVVVLYRAPRVSAPVSLVCFDLGRVLVRIRSWPEACASVGIPPQALALDEVFLATARDLFVQLETGAIDPPAFAGAAAALGRVSPDRVLAALDAILLGPVPGVPVILDALLDRGVRLACLSNTNARHWATVHDASPYAPLGLHRMPVRVASHLACALKPSPAVYALVERDASVDPRSILFFDDLAENVASARARGWQAEQVDPAGDVPAQLSDALRVRGVLQR